MQFLHFDSILAAHGEVARLALAPALALEPELVGDVVDELAFVRVEARREHQLGVVAVAELLQALAHGDAVSLVQANGLSLEAPSAALVSAAAAASHVDVDARPRDGHVRVLVSGFLSGGRAEVKAIASNSLFIERFVVAAFVVCGLPTACSSVVLVSRIREGSSRNFQPVWALGLGSLSPHGNKQQSSQRRFNVSQLPSPWLLGVATRARAITTVTTTFTTTTFNATKRRAATKTTSFLRNNSRSYRTCKRSYDRTKLPNERTNDATERTNEATNE